MARKLMAVPIVLLLLLAALAQESVPPWQARYFPCGSREATEEFLRSARIVQVKPLGMGVTNPKKVSLDDGKIQHFSIFKDIDQHLGTRDINGVPEVDFKDSWKYEIAAYELDKLLGLDMVPVTIERAVDGKKGSLQIWIDGCMTDTERQKKKINCPNPHVWNNQMYKVRVFDNLLFNIDRNEGNLLVSPEWKIYMIDHTRCFKNATELRRPQYMENFSRSFIAGLRKLDKETVKARCKDYLSAYEIDCLMGRRDLILKYYENSVAEKGEKILYP